MLRHSIYPPDSKGAFLYSEIDTAVYMEQPEGFEKDPSADEVCELLKGIYGLKQAS